MNVTYKNKSSPNIYFLSFFAHPPLFFYWCQTPLCFLLKREPGKVQQERILVLDLFVFNLAFYDFTSFTSFVLCYLTKHGENVQFCLKYNFKNNMIDMCVFTSHIAFYPSSKSATHKIHWAFLYTWALELLWLWKTEIKQKES